MAYEIKTQPGKNSAAYSAIPLRVYSDESLTDEKFEYLINIAFEVSTTTSADTVAFGNDAYTQLTFSANHKFNVGDTVLVDDLNNNNYYSNYYNVMKVVSLTKIIINLIPGPIISNPMKVYSVDRRRFSPDLQSEAKIDLSNTLKNYVTQDLKDANELYAAPNTRKDYSLILGKESIEVFRFVDNNFAGGVVAFNNPSLPASFLNTTSFKIGDSIRIQQDLVSWAYDDNSFIAGNLAFTSTNVHNFRVGQQVMVTGQVTFPQYNGPTTVKEVVDNYTFTTHKTFDGSTPAEPGVVLGTPVPEYNTVAIITNISYVPGTGILITTNQPYLVATQPIGGTIKTSNDLKKTVVKQTIISDLRIYNARVETLDYGFQANNFDKYVCQLRAFGLNNISTILGNTKKYRIEKNAKSWLLAHVKVSGNVAPEFRFYNKAGTLLSKILLSNIASTEDFYFPVGLKQLSLSTSFIQVSGPALSTIIDRVDSYDVRLMRTSTQFSNIIKFDVNKDCAGYDAFNVMWKDKNGSWLSYPFVYKSENRTEFERKTFYQNEGNWVGNTFGYDSFDRGEKTYFSRSRDKYTLSSGWVEEFENELIKDMMKSASVYIQKPDGVLIAATIESKDLKLGKQNSDNVWSYTFQFSAANNELRY